MDIKKYETLFTKILEQNKEVKFELSFFEKIGGIDSISDLLDVLILAHEMDIHDESLEKGKKVYIVLKPRS